MKPDSKNPGSVESAVNAESLAISNNSSELPVNSVQAEMQPMQGSGASPSQSTQQMQQHQKPLTSDDRNAAQSTNSKGNFETQIAQLPAEESDTIEQEWVDKVHEIELKAGNDPYHEDEAHHALSRAYLKKRFNIDVE